MRLSTFLWTLVILLVIFVYGISHTSERSYQGPDGKTYTALYIEAPAWSYVTRPDERIDVRPWVGRVNDPYTLYISGIRDMEYETAFALKWDEKWDKREGGPYEPRLAPNGHWILYRQGRSGWEYSPHTQYRISPDYPSS